MNRDGRLVDLSHEVEHGMITYKGLPVPIVCDFLSREASRAIYAPGTEFHIGKIEMVANTGTYVDSPFHRFAEGKDLSELPLESLADLDAVVVRCVRSSGLRGGAGAAGRGGGDGGLTDRERRIDANAFRGIEIRGRAVLVHTDWCSRWRTDAYFEGHPFLTADAAALLVERGAKLVGIDSYNIDDTDDGSRPVHTTLLGSEIPIVEHMRGLEQLPNEGFRFSAVPVKVKRFGTFPVRAFAVLV